MVKPAQTRPVPLPHNHIGSKGPWASPAENDGSCSLPATVDGHQVRGVAEGPVSAPTSAEIAQARVFERMLQAEFAHLNRLAYAMAGPLDRLKHPNQDSCQPSRELLRIHARIDEVHRLLVALQGRFPRTLFDREPQPE